MSSKDWIGYPALLESAFRSVARDALRHIAKGGTMGNHHFYITFDTQAPGVIVSDFLRSQHPDHLTIVLQNKFWDLKVFEDAFEVGLSFNKMPEVIRVPFAAMIQFVDPSQNIALPLRRQPQQNQSPRAVQPAPAPQPAPSAPKEETAKDAPPSGPTVISLDRFRKKEP